MGESLGNLDSIYSCVHDKNNNFHQYVRKLEKIHFGNDSFFVLLSSKHLQF